MNYLAASVGSAVIDLIVILVLLGFTLLGLKKGFANSFISMFGSILSIIFAVLLCSTVAKFLENKFMFVTNLSGGVRDLLNNVFGEEIMSITIGGATNNDMAQAGISQWLISIVFNVISKDSLPEATTLSQVISPIFAYYIAVAISVVILYTLFRIIFFLTGKIIEKAWKFKLVKKTDKILGSILGFLRGMITLQFIMMIISFLPIPFFQQITFAIDTSIFGNILSDINLLSVIINAITGTNNLVDMISSVLPKLQ